MTRGLLFAILALGLAACAEPADETATPSGVESISADELARHIQTLASDEFEGRAPSSPGEEKTLAYLEARLAEMGLSPANNGSWRQEVPLVSIAAGEDAGLSIAGGSENAVDFAYRDDMVIWTRRLVDSVDIEESELVFVGYGVVAPEYGWDDYAGVDVAGKTVVILINDPGYATEDPALFNGKAMTYYGRWTYKFEEAARQGAAAAIIVHETAPAAYGWEVVENSWTGPLFDIDRGDGDEGLLEAESWITADAARQLFFLAGEDFAALKAGALSPEFEAVELGLTASMRLTNTIRRSTSANVAGLLRGSEAPDEVFIYMAHWDHLGRDPSLDGDQIYNGALDNASGTAAVLEIAEAFASLDKPPRRSVLFLFVTAEEQGLLGSAHYAENPLVPPARTVGGLNVDGINDYGLTHDMAIIGYGQSELDGIMEEVLAAQGRRIVPDPEPERGYYYRSDHFELAKKGVPMIYPGTGIDHVTGGEEYGRERLNAYVVERYHKPSDEFTDAWDLTGAVADTKAYFGLGLAVANSADWPNWHESSEFRAARDASLSSGAEQSD